MSRYKIVRTEYDEYDVYVLNHWGQWQCIGMEYATKWGAKRRAKQHAAQGLKKPLTVAEFDL